jgi:hypothetical protein
MTVQGCPPSTSCTPGVVVFVPADFKASFPSFATVADAALAMSFQLATLQLSNGCGSRIKDAAKRELFLNLLTAHITALKDGENGQPPAGIVGRVSSATEGSVSVKSEVDTSGVYGKDYYAQTQWGFMYWNATAKFRTMVYIAAPPVCADFNGGLGFPGAFWPNNSGPGGDGSGNCGC